MAAGMGGLAGCLWLLSLLGGHLVAEDVLSHVAFVQRTLASEKGPAEFMRDINGDEVYHVDLEQKETVWWLPQFPEFVSFEAQGALSNIAILRSNLDILMRRSNYTPEENVPPQVTVYSEKPVELGEPNLLICLADEFSPPVVKLTWLKNGQKVEEHVQETVFYPSRENTFRRFSYLPFVPEAEDVYYCRVEHWGLAQPLTKEWNANMAEPVPETGENVVCGLGLVLGIVGVIVGTVLIVKSRQMDEANLRRRPI
ncbi:HLA class II histocompatibility antigen, DR alpha chain-like isoform X2 [Eublepharis macularius]|uniref:HLA class II histocompatibility antigen, DR alpha chain-like isoform X2 n=1 Tax=Eublepharis macularius TaxID=481883 RepID=A0AA97J8M9_EUBMA|nr:HLA class II histocompatibility antigen, DR alpha chain-like isoform X2 [Eublepharis macularius]